MKDNILQGVNVVAYEKDGNKYGMSCAWATHVDYYVILLLIGSQSDTGNNLKIGDSRRPRITPSLRKVIKGS